MKHKRGLMSITMATIVLVSLCAVCASTSVGAAAGSGSSKASVQAQPDLTGAPIAAGTSPTACKMSGSTFMYIFVKGYDGALWFRLWDETHSAWTGSWISLGGQLSSSPAATSVTAGHMDVYVRGTDGLLYARWTGDSAKTWTGWYVLLAGQLAPGTGPAACVEDANTKDLFVTGTNYKLYWSHWTSSTGFTAFTSLGGQLTSSPAATSLGLGFIDVYVRGTNGAVYGIDYYGGGWGPGSFHSLGGQVAPGTGPGICSYGAGLSEGRLDVFVEGTNGALYQKTWTQANGWSSSWTNLGGGLSASPTAATFTWGGTMDMPVFVRGSNGLIYFKEYFNGFWRNWNGPWQGPP